MSAVAKLVANVRGVYRACGPVPAMTYIATIARTLPAVARTRTLIAADHRMANRSWLFRAQGVEVMLEGRLFSGAREMYGRSVYFPDQNFQLESGTTVVDLGANTGLFSLLAALRGCRVIAVEAQIGFVEEIEALARRHRVANRIALEHALVGAHSGVLAKPGAMQRASHFRNRQPERLTMAELFARHSIDHVDFLKCDIEGSEFDMFASDTSWLSAVRRIAMEVHCNFGSTSELVVLLERAGYAVTLRDNLLRSVRSLQESSGYLFAIR